MPTINLLIEARKRRERIEGRPPLAAHAVAHGYDLVAVEEDAGLSGKLAPHRRPALARVLKALKAGQADGVVVLKLDRLARSTRHTLDLVEESAGRGWRLVSVSESLDTGSATGRLVVTILAALAQMEREQIGERTKLGMDQVARQGRARSRFIPFGFRLEGSDATEVRAGDRSQFVEHHPEQRILRQMLCLRGEGNGAYKTARLLNEQGIGNPRTGRPWAANTVAAILRSHDRRRAATEGAS